MEKKNNKGLVITIVILSLLVVGLGGYIIYDKIDFKSTDNSKKEADELDIEYPYIVSETIKKSDGTKMGYVLCEIDTHSYQQYNIETCMTNTYSYYSIQNGHDKTNYESVKYLNDDYMAAVVAPDEEDWYVNILNIKTGKVEKKIDYLGISEEKIGDNNYYIANTGFGDDDRIILDSNFRPIIKDYEVYVYAINSDKTITILPYHSSEMKDTLTTTFAIYDFQGNKISESKEYTETIIVGKDFLILNDNGNINVVDKNEKIINHITTLDNEEHSGQVNNGRKCYKGNCEPICLSSLIPDKPNRTIYYNYETNTFRIEQE